MTPWRCPGCDAGPYDGSEVVDHVRDCDWVDGAARPVPYATVLIVVPAGVAAAYVQEILDDGQAVYFAGALPGITPDATRAGADPSSWPDEDA